PEVVVDRVVDVAALGEEKQPLRGRQHQVVPHRVLLGVLDPDLAEARTEGVVAEQGVVAELAAADPSYGLGEAAEDEPRLLVGEEEMVAYDDPRGDDAVIFRSDLDAEVGLGDDVSPDRDVAPAVDVDPAGETAALLPRALHPIAAAHPVARHLGA